MTDSEKLDLLLEQMMGVKADISELRTDNSGLRADVSGLKADVSELKADISELKADVSELKADMADVKTRVGRLENEVSSVKIILENEIRVNIQRVAEGHLDLSRHLQELEKPNQEFEWLAIKVRTLESDVRDLKKKTAAL